MKIRPVTNGLACTSALLFGILSTPAAKAEWKALPAAQISSKTLGGEVLLIQMKHSLIIDGDVSAKILFELGASAKKSFLSDMIKSKPVPVLVEAYDRPDRPATHLVIEKYMSLIGVQPPLT